MMQHQLCMIGGWLNPVSVRDNKELGSGKDVKIQPWRDLRTHGVVELTPYAIQDHVSEYPTVLESNWEMMSLRDAFSSPVSGLPSIEDLICISQQCRRERCLAHAMSAYALTCDCGLEAHEALGNYLVPMFVDCGSVLNAQQLFNKLLYCNDCSWTCLIRGYTEAGDMHCALDLGQVMHDYGVHPSKFAFVALLTACVELKSIEKGRKLHAEIAEEGLETDAVLGNMLVNMYVNFGSLVECRDVLNRLPVRDVISWTTLISGYAEHGLVEEAFSCLEQMQLEGLAPNATSYVCALKACGGVGAIGKGREMHAEIMMKGFDEDIVVGNILINMYAKCALLAEAQNVFDEMRAHDVISWTTLIAGYAEHGPSEEALNTMEQMQHNGVFVNTFTFVCALKACGSMGDLGKGQLMHAEITKMGFEKDLFIGNMLVDLYAKRGLLEESCKVFNQLPIQDVVTCTALITAYLENGLNEDVLKCMDEMQVWGVSPNAFTLVCGLKACCELRDLARGRELHCEIANKGLEGDLIVNTTLMDMYARCESPAETSYLFNSMHVRDIVSWSIMIISSVEYKESKSALEMFAQMKEQGCMPDHGILVSILKACGNTGAIDVGKKVHSQFYRAKALDPNMSSALIDMYGKCGNMVDAQDVFDEMQGRDLVAWSSLITGYAREGECQLAFDLFDRMMCEGIRPDRVAFLTIMSVCNHVGLHDRAQRYFEIMTKNYAIAPTIKHCTCLIDLLGRAGQLDEAVDMADKMTFEGNPILWITVLGACRMWKNVALGRLAFDRVVALDEKDSGAYISMSNIYGDAHMWEDAKKIETMRIHMQASEESEKSWTEIGGLVHRFVAEGDKKHPQCKEILSKLNGMGAKLEASDPHNLSGISSSSLDVPENVVSWCKHSEIVAIACGLINSHEGDPLHVVKNAQLCIHCHQMMAFVSKVEVRTIFCRDANLLHVFKDGKCVCGSL
eukprot:c22087_g1_i1 orf=558-3443(+)